MKYTLRTTNKFEKSVKRCIRRNYPMDELRKVMTLLVETGTLPTTYRSHKLQGKTFNETTIEAMNDAKMGNTIKCHSFEEYLKLVE